MNKTDEGCRNRSQHHPRLSNKSTSCLNGNSMYASSQPSQLGDNPYYWTKGEVRSHLAVGEVASVF